MLQVARGLLGQLLVREVDGEVLVARIVETEAYAGRTDPSSHSFRGRTARCRAMFGPAGRAYVYFTYGNHHCMNVVAGPRPAAGAVLIRAVEPVAGLAEMRRHRAAAGGPGLLMQRIRAGRADLLLGNGPGKLTRSLRIDRALDEHPLTRPGPLWIARGPRVRSVDWTPRVGLGRNPAASWCWRCVARGSAFASPVPGHWPRRPRPAPTLGHAARLHGA